MFEYRIHQTNDRKTNITTSPFGTTACPKVLLRGQVRPIEMVKFQSPYTVSSLSVHCLVHITGS